MARRQAPGANKLTTSNPKTLQNPDQEITVGAGEKRGGLASEHGASNDVNNAKLDCQAGRPRPLAVPQVALFLH